jgi:hypothetical protein
MGAAWPLAGYASGGGAGGPRSVVNENRIDENAGRPWKSSRHVVSCGVCAKEDLPGESSFALSWPGEPDLTLPRPG